MFYVREFEFFEDEGYMLAVPFDLGPGTFGEDMDDAVEMAADYMNGLTSEQPATTKFAR